MLTDEEKVADLRDVVIRARDQFAFYEQQHLAKSPADTTKAKVNADYAAMCSKSLTRTV